MKNQTRITADPGKQEIFIIREFDAPRELVFRAHTGSGALCAVAWTARIDNDAGEI